jgi:predicted acetyltransferase
VYFVTACPRPPKPYWYLAHIGSHPSVRGSGYANALMEQRMRHVRMGDAPAYLVCTRPETSPFYERFGFAVLDTFALADGGPLVQGMWCRQEE